MSHRYVIKDSATGLFQKNYGDRDHWVANPLEAKSYDDPRNAAHFAADDFLGVRRPFEVAMIVISTRVVAAEPYSKEEYWDRTVRTGPPEAVSVPCPQCRAKRGEPCVGDGIGDSRYEVKNGIHGLRRAKHKASVS